MSYGGRKENALVGALVGLKMSGERGDGSPSCERKEWAYRLGC